MSLSHFGEWELLGQLGSGGFGEVLHWRNWRSKQEIATKRLKPNERLNDDEIIKLKQRWTQEYQWMQQLSMPYIVRAVNPKDQKFVTYLNDHHAWQPLPVIVMEYCNSSDLRTHLQKVENLNGLQESEVRYALHALSCAIQYLHDICRIEHRDLKPDNVVIHCVNGRRYYKLTDFGFARNTSDQTIVKSVVGTRNYLAPEIIDTAKYSNTVDYWSLGIIAFELMCGILPFIPHQIYFEIITNIKRKPRPCICITENPDKPQEYEFHEQVFAENRMSRVFRTKICEWLRLALDVNGKTRGRTVLAAADNVDPRGTLQFYSVLDNILRSEVLTVFCINTAQFLSYEVTPTMTMEELMDALEEDIKHHRKPSSCKKAIMQPLVLIFPTGHPCPEPTRPIDIYADEFLTTNETMLYVFDLQRDYENVSPAISDVIKKTIQLSTDSNVPKWYLEKCAQHTHFLISTSQWELKALLTGLKQYAVTVEDEILQFGKNWKVSVVILILRGRVEQFFAMLNIAQRLSEQKSSNCSGFYEKWQAKAIALRDSIHTFDAKIVLSVTRRYASVERRIKELVKHSFFETEPLRDIYGLGKFRETLRSDRQKCLLGTCQSAIYGCLNKRKEFLSHHSLLQIRNGIANVASEFIKIKNIVDDMEKKIAEFEQTLDSATSEFLNNLQNVGANGLSLNSEIKFNSLMSDGIVSAAENDDWLFLDEIFNLPTNVLVQDAIDNVRLLMDVDDIPATVNTL